MMPTRKLLQDQIMPHICSAGSRLLLALAGWGLVMASWLWGVDAAAGSRASKRRPGASKQRRASKRRKPSKARAGWRNLKRTYWRSLVYRLRRPSPRYQRRLARELRRRGETRALPYLLGMLRKRKQPGQRQGALRGLAQLQVPWTLPILLARRKDPSLQVQMTAWEALGDFCAASHCRRLRLGGQGQTSHPQHRVTEALFAKLAKANAAMTKVLLRALSTIDPEGTPEGPKMLQALQALYKGKRPPGTGLWYSRALATLGDPTKRQTWQQLASTRPTWTGQRLSRWPGRWASRMLAAGLQHKQARRRAQAARWLLQRLDPSRAKALQAACQRKALATSRCRRLRPRLAMHLTPLPPFPTTSAPLFAVTRVDATKAHAALVKRYPQFTARVAQISQRMLGTPYILDPLGEGKRGRYDKDPIFTLKRVDCVTFVEQVIAMSHAPSLPKAIQFAQRIRYDNGKIDYRYRRHLPIAQWLPAMIKMGIGRDITRQVGGEQTSTLIKTLDAKSYSTREGRRLQKRLGKDRVVMGHFKLPYLTHDVALARLKRIPSGTIISSLRNHNPYSPGQVTHQGLLIRRKGVLYMRHASSLWRSVVDVPLRTYLRILKNYPRPRIGIHLLQLLPPTKG